MTSSRIALALYAFAAVVGINLLVSPEHYYPAGTHSVVVAICTVLWIGRLFFEEQEARALMEALFGASLAA